ncbi:MAG: hypothetical protein AAB336_08150 [Acidobacteriota bacterium]
MNKKIFVLLFALIFTVNSTFAQVKKTASVSKKTIPVKKVVSQATQLASLLPNSDAVLNVQMSRLMNEGLPQMLSTKPQYLQEINSKIDEIKSNIGIDLRQFEQIAVGIAYKTISPKETDYEPVILARGKFNSGAFLGLAKVAAKGKYREEKIGEKTVYIFTPSEILAENKSNTKDSFINKMIEKAMSSFKKEIAVTSFDDNTLVMGSMERVRQTFESKERVNQNVLDLAGKNPNAMLSFGANMPAGASQFLPIENDELGKNIESINQMYGALDLKDGKTTLAVSAKTSKADQAQSLEETLAGLQMVGKALLGGSKRADQQLYARLLENAVIARKASEVSLNLTVPKTDMDALMAILLKN